MLGNIESVGAAMKVKANVNILYRREVYERGKEFEMDDVSAQICAKRGTVTITGDSQNESEIEASEGLPDLVEEKAGKKKK